MKSLLGFMLMFSLCVACSSPKKRVNPSNVEELSMLIGTYTDGESKGIYSYRFNQETGDAVALSSVEVPNPSYLTPSADGSLVYAVSEMNDSTAALNAFAFERASGTLRLLNRFPTLGADPCYVATNGREVLAANYSGGSMTVFPLKADGSLEPADTLFEGGVGGPDVLRQATPHLHCAVFSPDGKYIFATDFSADRILRFVLHLNSIIPHLAEESVMLNPDFGPRHLIFSPNGKNAYVIGELSGDVTAFSYDDGKLSPIQTIAADTLRARGSADIRLSPDGRYLYASNRLRGDGIAIFEVNPSDGSLAKVGYQPTGAHPRNFAITPNGKYLLAACRDDNVIQVFERNAETGFLTDTHKDIHLSKPVCVCLIP